MIIYGDLLFALNLLVDYVLLYLAGRAAGARVDHRRLAAAAALGGAYAVGQALGLTAALYGLGGILLTSLLLLAVAYAPMPWRLALRLLAWFYGAAVGLAGADLAIVYLRADALGRTGAAGGGLPLIALAVPLALAAGLAIWLGSARRLRTAAPQPQLVPVVVAVGEAEARLLALVDTGNHLRDPFGQDPVLVAEVRALQSLLPPALVHGLRGAEPAWEDIVGRVEGSPWAARLRLIPYRSLGAGSRVLLGFRPDRVRVAGREALPTIGLSPVPLDPDGRYQALCPAALANRVERRTLAATGAVAS